MSVAPTLTVILALVAHPDARRCCGRPQQARAGREVSAMSASIVLTGLSSSDPVPGTYIQIAFAQGQVAGFQGKRPILLVGNKTSAGSATNPMPAPTNGCRRPKLSVSRVRSSGSGSRSCPSKRPGAPRANAIPLAPATCSRLRRVTFPIPCAVFRVGNSGA